MQQFRCMTQVHVLILKAALLIEALSIALADPQSSLRCSKTYSEVSNGSLCIRNDFTRTVGGIASDLQCSLQCGREPRCQAFTIADGPCQLFVFDKCSKSVRDCSCSRRGRLFVKRQSGLEPGALCPSGYGDELCGVKYKYNSSSDVWAAHKYSCETNGGLAMLADVIDTAEMSHVNQLFSKYGSVAFFLDGQQLPGSVEPAGGWSWAGCNIPLDSSLWAISEPNNALPGENVTIRGISNPGLADASAASLKRGLCECVSPFD